MSTQETPSAVAAAPGPGGGVIHDIGYRHYEGARLGSGYVRRSLFVESLKGAYGLGRSARSKVVPILLTVVMCFPAFVMVIVTSMTGADQLPDGYGAYPFTMQVVLTIFIAAQAPALVSRDLRFRSVALYFSRPLSRSDYVHAKLAAMATAVFILIALPLTILFGGALLAKIPVGDQLPLYLRAVGAAALYALALACIGLVIAAITPRRGVGVAAIVAVLLVLSGVQGAVLAIAGEAGEDTLATYAGMISPFGLVDGVARGLLRTDTGGLARPEGGEAVAYAVGLLLLLAGCYLALRARYRKVAVA